MDSQNLHLYIDFVGSSGVILSPEQKAALQTSLVILKNNHKFSQVKLWGKILGIKDDYYIAQGFSDDPFAVKTTLYRCEVFYSIIASCYLTSQNTHHWGRGRGATGSRGHWAPVFQVQDSHMAFDLHFLSDSVAAPTAQSTNRLLDHCNYAHKANLPLPLDIQKLKSFQYHDHLIRDSVVATTKRCCSTSPTMTPTSPLQPLYIEALYCKHE